MNRTISSVIAATVMFASYPAFAAELGWNADSTSILGGLSTAFAATSAGSLAWAGENETFVDLSMASNQFQGDSEVNVQLVTGLAAPEPPAIVLAGMAIGGVFCGRSMLRKRTPTSAHKEDRS
ncbi:MAG: hypothetical protein K8S94_06930 [Planctomycetia bacterium]|nr:hypothetical protein [Planctomycetia bacterium]